MLLTDALSHLPSRANNSEIQLNLRVNAISISTFSRSQLTKTAEETQRDLILSTVHRLTLNGWPEKLKTCPQDSPTHTGISGMNSQSKVTL